MKPPAFDHVAPREIEEVLDLLGQYGDAAKIIAGGQSLGPMLNFRVAAPEVLIDVNRVAGLDRLDWGEGLGIGALTRQGTLEDNPDIARLQPLVARTIPHIAHRPIRNRGTVGGSLSHADPAAEWGALALALDATFVIAHKGQAPREVPAGAFHQGWMETVLGDDELLTEIRLPPWPANSGCAFMELARRHGDFALAGVACRLTMNADGGISDARLAMIGVADRPLRLTEVEALLRGETPAPALFDAAAEAGIAALEPMSDSHASADYRRRISRVLIRDALAEAHRNHAAPAPATPVTDNPAPTAEQPARRPAGAKGGAAPLPLPAAEISLRVNGAAVTRKVEARTTLADFLREGLGLTGTHVGCEHGICGACTVLVDGRAQRSCIRFAVQCDGTSIETIEGLSGADTDDLHALQRAFGEHGALQCGFCTPGFLMTAAELVARECPPDESGVRAALSGSLCRCTGYEPIVRAVMDVLQHRHDERKDPGTNSKSPLAVR